MSIAATVSFPGLGLGPFELNRVAFTIFGKEVYWYGVIIATGFFLGVSLALKLAELNGLDPDKIFNVVLITAPVAIVGARVYYVMTTLERYDSFYEMIAIWNGGIAIYGAVLAGMACIAVLCKLWKLPLLKVLDIAAPAVILGQGIGRWGNFVNREAFGGPTRNLFRMELIIDGVPNAVHPTFLYESVWDLVGCALLVWIFFHKKADGQTTYGYFLWYGIGRFFIEGLRTDSLYVGTFRISQLVSLALIAVALVGFARIRKNRKNAVPAVPQPAEGPSLSDNDTAPLAEMPSTDDVGDVFEALDETAHES
ncbi:MAG: prolipoprotein diacylglyceryl transferase [Clostridia bacterium]|nr:prolipoprotein diacylglyceryl transferase [Clostridia bacterium]